LPSTQYTDYISTALDVLPRLQTKAINAWNIAKSKYHIKGTLVLYI
jgi:hypothetical protein